jgi:adenine deaminase
VQETWINGQQVAKEGKSLIKGQKSRTINNFHVNPITYQDIKLDVAGAELQTIVAIDHQLITQSEWHPTDILDDNQVSLEHDILKLVVLNRYNQSKPAVAFIKNFGLKHGAIASTVAHDSHNIIAVGTNDEELTLAINNLIDCKGGISAIGNGQTHLLPLPVAGLMSTDDGAKVAEQYTLIDNFTKHELGSTLTSPFMTLSFMALLVIPSIKLSDQGLFDGEVFQFTQLFR